MPCKVGGSSSQSHPNQSLVSEKRGVYTFVHSSRRVYRKEGPVASIKREREQVRVLISRHGHPRHRCEAFGRVVIRIRYHRWGLLVWEQS